MTKLILIVVAVVAVIWIVRRAIAGPRRSGGAGDAPGAATPGELVACAQCGVNLPKSEAYAASGVPAGLAGKFYCSEEHLRAGPKGG